MKHLKNIFHTSDITHEDPYLKLNDYFLLHRATPHPTTKKYPAELLFNRKFYTTLPSQTSATTQQQGGRTSWN